MARPTKGLGRRVSLAVLLAEPIILSPEFFDGLLESEDEFALSIPSIAAVAQRGDQQGH